MQRDLLNANVGAKLVDIVTDTIRLFKTPISVLPFKSTLGVRKLFLILTDIAFSRSRIFCSKQIDWHFDKTLF